MTKIKTLVGALAVCFLLWSPTRASAEFVLEFGRDDVVASDGSQFMTNVVPDSMVSMQVFLTQTGGETRLTDPVTGLVNADFVVDVTSGGTGMSPITFSYGPGLADDQTGNSGINGQSLRIASVEQNGNPNMGATTGMSAGANSVLIGTINYSIDPGAIGTFTLTAQKTTPGLFQFAVATVGSNFPTNIDVMPGSATIVSAIPEPTCLPMIAMGLCIVGYRRRRT